MSTVAPAKPAPTSKSEAFVEQQLARARRRIRLLDISASLLGLFLLTGLYALGITLFGKDLPGRVCQAAFIAYAVVSAVYLALTLVRPLLRTVNPHYAALQVEQAVPNAKNSLINWIDLRTQKLPSAIRAAVSHRAAKDMAKADLETAISGRRAAWLGGLAGLLLVVLAAQFVRIGAPQFLRLLGLAFLPFGSTEVGTRTTLVLLKPEGGHATVMVGRPVSFAVQVKGKVPSPTEPDAVRLLYRYNQTDPYEEQRLEREDQYSRTWVTLIPGFQVHNGFWYKIAGGDFETDEYRVQVRSNPLLSDFEVTYHYRPYLGWPDSTTREPNLKALRGTGVTLTARANRNIKQGSLELERSKKTVAAELVPGDPQAMRFRFVLDQAEADDQYRIRFVSTEDERSAEPPIPYDIKVLRDFAPKVELTQPGKDVTLPANGVLRLEGKASDDFGLTGLTLRMQLGEKDALPEKPYREGKKEQFRLPDGGYPQTLEYKDFVELDKVKQASGQPLQAGMVLEYWLEAFDACDFPPPGPNVGTSQKFKVTLTEPLKDEQKKDQQEQARKDQQEHEKKQDQDLKNQQKKQPDGAAAKEPKPEQTEEEKKLDEEKRKIEEAIKEEKKEQERQKNQGECKGDSREENKGGSKGEGNNDPNGGMPEEKGEAKPQPNEDPGQGKGEGKQQPDGKQQNEGEGKGAGQPEAKPQQQQDGGEKGDGKPQPKPNADAGEGKGEGKPEPGNDPKKNEGDGKGPGQENNGGQQPGEPRDAGNAEKKPDAGQQGDPKGAGQDQQPNPGQAEPKDNKGQAKGEGKEEQRPDAGAKDDSAKGGPKDGGQPAKKPGAGQGDPSPRGEPKGEGKPEDKPGGPGQQAAKGEPKGEGEKKPGAGQAEPKGDPKGEGKRQAEGDPGEGQQRKPAPDGNPMGEAKGEPPQEPRGEGRDSKPEEVPGAPKKGEARDGEKQPGQGKGQCDAKPSSDKGPDGEQVARGEPKGEGPGEKPGETQAAGGEPRPGQQPGPGSSPGTKKTPGEDLKTQPGAAPDGGRPGQSGEKPEPGEGDPNAPPGGKKGETPGQQGKPSEGEPGSQKGRGSEQAAKPGDQAGPGGAPGTGATRREGDPAGAPGDTGEGVPADARFQQQAGDLQLEDIKKRVTKDTLKKANMTEEDYERFLQAYQEMLKRQRDARGPDERLVDPKRPGGTLPNQGPRRVTRPDAREMNVQGGGPALPPPEFRDAYKEFTEKLSTLERGREKK